MAGELSPAQRVPLPLHGSPALWGCVITLQRGRRAGGQGPCSSQPGSCGLSAGACACSEGSQKLLRTVHPSQERKTPVRPQEQDREKPSWGCGSRSPPPREEPWPRGACPPAPHPHPQAETTHVWGLEANLTCRLGPAASQGQGQSSSSSKTRKHVPLPQSHLPARAFDGVAGVLGSGWGSPSRP